MIQNTDIVNNIGFTQDGREEFHLDFRYRLRINGFGVRTAGCTEEWQLVVVCQFGGGSHRQVKFRCAVGANRCFHVKDSWHRAVNQRSALVNSLRDDNTSEDFSIVLCQGAGDGDWGCTAHHAVRHVNNRNLIGRADKEFFSTFDGMGHRWDGLAIVKNEWFFSQFLVAAGYNSRDVNDFL